MRHLLPGLCFLIVSVVIISCSEEKEQTVDQDYLNSQEYSSFKDNADSERQKNAEASKTLSQDLQKISGCSSAERFTLPFSTNEDDLAERVQSASDECQLDGEMQTITLLGKHEVGDISIQFALLQRETVYTDDELLAVTFNGDELLSFTTVGIYQKNPTREITSEVTFEMIGNDLSITSVTNRNIKYPIDQNNSIKTVYEVDTKGGIKEL